MHLSRYKASVSDSPDAPTRCVRCDYEVDPSVHKTCPECGLSFDDASATYRGTLAPRWPFEIAFLALVAAFVALAWITFP